jgi:hypothetical protein
MSTDAVSLGDPIPVRTIASSTASCHIFPAYTSEQYLSAQLSWPDSDLATISHDYYLALLSAEVTTAIADDGGALLAVIDASELTEWAAYQDLDPNDPTVRRAYLHQLNTAEFTHLARPEDLVAIMSSCELYEQRNRALISAVHSDPTASLGIVDLLEYNDVDAAEALLTLVLFLEDVVKLSATISYAVEGAPLPIAGSLTVKRSTNGSVGFLGELQVEFVHSMLAIAGLGPNVTTTLVIRCDDETEDSVLRARVYGWLMTPDGFAGLSEATMFSLACTDSDGEPIPPEFGVSYLGVDMSTYRHSRLG